MPLISRFITKEYYKKILKRLTNVPFTHTCDWLQIVEEGMNLDVFYIATYQDNEYLIAITPIFIKKSFPLKLIGSPLRGSNTQKLGPIFIENSNDSNLFYSYVYSLEKLFDFKYNYFELVFNTFEKKNNILNLKGFKNYKFKTSIISLIDEKSNWRKFQSRARNMIRKSEKNNVIVTIREISEEWIDKFFFNLEITFLKQGIAPPHTKKFYKNLIKIQDNIVVLEGKLNDEFLSGGIFLKDKEKITFLSGVSTPLGMKLAASSLIQWEIIKYGISNKFKYYDMGGLGVKSIDKFKLSFGGQIVYFDKYINKDKIFIFCEKYLLHILLKLTFLINAVKKFFRKFFN